MKLDKNHIRRWMLLEEFLFSIKNHHCAHWNGYRKKTYTQHAREATEENSTQPSYKFNKLVNCSLFYILSSSPLLCSFSLSTTQFNIQRRMTMIIAGWIAYISTTIWAPSREVISRRRNWEPPLCIYESRCLRSRFISLERGTSSTFTVFLMLNDKKYKLCAHIQA